MFKPGSVLVPMLLLLPKFQIVVVQNYPASSALIVYNNSEKQIELKDFTIDSQNTSGYTSLINIYSSGSSLQTNININSLKINGQSVFSTLLGDYAINLINSNGKNIMSNCIFNSCLYDLYTNKSNNINLNNNQSVSSIIFVSAENITDINIFNNRVRPLYYGISVFGDDEKVMINNNQISLTTGAISDSTIFGIFTTADSAVINANTIDVSSSLGAPIRGISISGGDRIVVSNNAINILSSTSNEVYGMYIINCNNSVILNSTIKIDSKNKPVFNYGTTTQGLLSVGGADLFTEKYSAYRGLAYSGLKLLKSSEDLGGSFPSANVIANTMRCTPIAKNLTSTTYAWTKSGSGTSEYYCRLAAGTNPGVSSPQTLYINDISKTTALLGSLTTGTWNYGDNDALGYSTVYVCLTRGDSGYADPDVSPLTYTIKVEEQKTFSRNPAVILWDWYRHVENYSIDEMDDLSWKSLEVVCNQIPISEGGPIRPPGPSRETVKETSYIGQSSENDQKGCYAFDINRSIDGIDIGNGWLSNRMGQIPFIGDFLGLSAPGRQRLNVDLGVEGILTKIVLVNYHDSGGGTDRGIKTFSMQCSNTSSDLAITGYLGTGSSWVSIPAIFLPAQYSATTPEISFSISSVSQTTIPYRYYSLKIQDNHGDGTLIGLRDCCLWIKSKRYLFDYIYDNAVEINDAKKLIWQSYNGSAIRSQGKLKPVFKWYQEADGYGGVTDKVRRHTFTEANIIKDSFAWSIPERSSLRKSSCWKCTKN